MKGEQIILFDLFVASSNTRKKGRRGAGWTKKKQGKDFHRGLFGWFNYLKSQQCKLIFRVHISPFSWSSSQRNRTKTGEECTRIFPNSFPPIINSNQLAKWLLVDTIDNRERVNIFYLQRNR
jgi:hypothetical protein